MKKFYKIAVLLLLPLAAFILGGCTLASDNADIAVDYLTAVNDRNLTEAEDHICESRLDELKEGLLSATTAGRAQYTFENVSCGPRGDDVRCTYNIVQDIDTSQEDRFSRDIIFEFEDGKICGFQEGVAE